MLDAFDSDFPNLFKVLAELFARPETIESLGILARQAVRQVSGASDRNVAALARLLEERRP